MLKDRYKKIIDADYAGEEGLKKLQDAKVLILGAGGIGSNVIQNIAAIGVRNIGLVDNDIVESKNLSVQLLYTEESVGKYKVDECKKWVNKFDASIDIKTWNVRLDENNWENIFKNYDIIIGAFDTKKSKLLINKLAVQTNKPIIFGGVVNDFGRVWTTLPHQTPCFNCFVEHDSFYDATNIGFLKPICDIVSGLIAWEVAKLVLNKGSLISMTQMHVHALHSLFKRPRVFMSKTEKCPVCGLPRLSFTPFDENCIG